MVRRQALNAIADAGLAALARPQSGEPAQSNGMIYRKLGSTGERVSAIGLGGYHTSVPSEEWITAYLKNGGKLEVAQQMAAHESPRTTGLYDRRSDDVSLDEVERIYLSSGIWSTSSTAEMVEQLRLALLFQT